jgi:hypothetical protein
MDRLAVLGAEAIRAGTLAHEAARTGQLVRELTDCVRNGQAWLAEWRRQHLDLSHDPGEEDLLADQEEAVRLLMPHVQALSPIVNRLHDTAIAVPGAEETQSTSQGKRHRRMTVAEAEAQARKLYTRNRRRFAGLSKRQQAAEIGCTFATWAKTDLHKYLYPGKVVRGGRSKAAVSLPGQDGGPAEGRRDEVLQQLSEQERARELAKLISEQEADCEPSPFDGDGNRPQKVKVRKRV